MYLYVMNKDLYSKKIGCTMIYLKIIRQNIVKKSTKLDYSSDLPMTFIIMTILPYYILDMCNLNNQKSLNRYAY